MHGKFHPNQTMETCSKLEEGGGGGHGDGLRRRLTVTIHYTTLRATYFLQELVRQPIKCRVGGWGFLVAPRQRLLQQLHTIMHSIFVALSSSKAPNETCEKRHGRCDTCSNPCSTGLKFLVVSLVSIQLAFRPVLDTNTNLYYKKRKYNTIT